MADGWDKDRGTEKVPFLQHFRLFSPLPSPPPPPPPTPPTISSLTIADQTKQDEDLPSPPSQLLWKPPVSKKELKSDTTENDSIEVLAPPLPPPPTHPSSPTSTKEDVLSSYKSFVPHSNETTSKNLTPPNKDIKTARSPSLSPIRDSASYAKISASPPLARSPISARFSSSSGRPPNLASCRESVVSIRLSPADHQQTNNDNNSAKLASPFSYERRASTSSGDRRRSSASSYMCGGSSSRRRSSGSSSLAVPIGRDKRRNSASFSRAASHPPSNSLSVSVPSSASGRRGSSANPVSTPIRRSSGSSSSSVSKRHNSYSPGTTPSFTLSMPNTSRRSSASPSLNRSSSPSPRPYAGSPLKRDRGPRGISHSKFHHVSLRKLNSCPDYIGETASDGKRVFWKSSAGKRFWFRSQNSIILTNDNGYYSILDFQEMKSHWEIMKKRRTCLRLLLIVVRISLWIQKSREKSNYQNKPQTLAELNYYSQYTAFNTQTMTFNKSEFAKSTSCNATIPLWARFAMEEDPAMRSPAKIKRLVALFKHLSAFHESLSSSAQEEYCKHCQYMSVDERQVILKAGHPSYFSYLLISGSVFVNIIDEDPNTGKKCYRTTRVLQEGALFGEVSLVRKLPRFASYIARERTELIVLDEAATVKLLAAGINRELSLKVQYIKEHDLFSDWPEDLITKLAGVCESTSYPFNAVIERDVSMSMFIYMVIEGTIEILTSSSIGSLAKDFTPADRFTDLGLFQRLKSPNQCSKYRNLSLSDRHAFISLELLTPFNICDVRSLLPSSLTSPRLVLILVSHGAKILKIPKHHLHCIPSTQWRQLTNKAKATPYYPSEEVFLQLHQEHLQWNRFKSLLTRDLVEEVYGTALASKPSFLKGQCGWSKPKPPPPCADCRFKECLSSDVPLSYHGLYRSCHDGCCILDYAPPPMKLPYNQRLTTHRIVCTKT